MKGGNSAKRDARAAEIAERARQALELRKGGATYDQIAKKLGFTDRSNARKDIQEAILAITEEPAKEVLQLELERLDAMLLGMWAKAKQGDVQCVDRVLRIMDRRAAYLGLDAPKKIESKTELSGPDGGAIEVARDALLDRVARLAAAFAESGGGGGDEPKGGG